jgi:Flp pilus assembly pilin Flp
MTRGALPARLLREEAGQDIVEYALLTGLIGIAGILVWQQLAATIAAVYSGTDASVQGLAAPPDPL